MSETDRSDVLVTAEWVDDHLDEFGSDDPEYRLVEADIEYDESYAETHIPGAIGFRWGPHLQDSFQRDILKKDDFAEMMGEHGITDDSTVVLYGDESNQWAAYTYWQFKYYGHDDVYLLDGGREYWLENDYPTDDEVPSYPEAEYDAGGPFDHLRIYREGVEDAIELDLPLVDVRSEAEYRGEKIAPEGSPETAQRAGHIPGATNITWSENLNDDGTFKEREELEALYEDHDITGDSGVVTYCRIGERSSITWFTLHELLGFEDVRNYDGSWTEWGNLIRSPIEAETDEPASRASKG
ncbi:MULTISPECIES: sulfurtransferase [unclassified Haladaptatus]|uniref:sulfurtransferase n=1 Tax=unclassified Haladaptatus TaxID=2622732 RepID=UPI00209C2675|nr:MULTISPECIES: sulfurtransferase [unclassified Haladaptatus]MCO8247047.1 sulfurtransferase [Haladaptatus sp. AB643]MCO8254569.1 sulfurtransferase [Haladaptatus sp. AB618]